MVASKSFSGRTCTGRKVSGTVEIVKTGYKVTVGKASTVYVRGEYGVYSMDDAAKLACTGCDF